jgi:DNA helicase II / ATP-dependent DNA helicase PcrA
VLEAWHGYRISRWPLRITGARVEAVETVVGTQAATVHAGLGPSGVWLAPRLFGMGYFDWNGEELDG